MRNSNKNGWVRLHRQIEDNELYFLEPFTKAQAWIDLFLNANHKDGIFSIRGNIIDIKRGQIGWSELTMAERWQWSKDKVRRFLKLLETIQQIRQQKSHLTTIITILKYEDYQKDDTTDHKAERPQKDHRQYTNKNEKNVKNEKKPLSSSEDGVEINHLLGLFKAVNPDYQKFFVIQGHRKAIQFLIKEFGVDKASNVIRFLPQLNSMPYAPTVTTPLELRSKLGAIKAFMEKERNKNVKGGVVL